MAKCKIVTIICYIDKKFYQSGAIQGLLFNLSKQSWKAIAAMGHFT